jgi:hypothetical protein
MNVRVEKRANVKAYFGFSSHEISWNTFRRS